MRFQLRNAKLLISILLISQSLPAWAQGDIGPLLMEKNLLRDAVQVRITPRGMTYFDRELNSILGNLGVKLDEGYFPEMSFSADKPINPDDFSDRNPEAVQVYKQLRSLLTQWLVGFSLNDHRPTIAIGESGYLANFSKFGLVTDEKLMRAIGKVDGAVLAIELEIKKMTVSTQSVLAWDMENDFLGKAGFQEVTLTAGDDENPLKVRLPFYIRMTAEGALEFEALEVENNFDHIPVGIKYKELVVPTFAVEVNGKKFFLNNDQIDKLFRNQAPFILQKIRENLAEFARNQLPGLLNAKAKEFFTGQLEQVQDMLPPGQAPEDLRPAFKWGLQLQKINLKESLNINLTGYVEDPINSRSKPKKVNGSRGLPSFGLLPAHEYDIALSLDRALVNRILQLSFERKNFERIQQSDGTILKLVAPPLIDYMRPPAGVAQKPTETFVKLRVAVENNPGTIFLKKTVVLEFDIVTKLRQLPDKSGMQLLLHSIDTNSLYLDEKYLSMAGKLVKGKVREGVQKELLKISAGWASKEESIPGSLPLPPQILGIQLDINQVNMDPNGHIVMFLNYGKEGKK